MNVEALAGVDPLALVIAHLSTHPSVETALGGTGRVSAHNRPPYPCVRVLDSPGGTDRDLTWLIAPTLDLAVYGDLDGQPGKAELRRITYVLLGVLADLPNVPVEPDGAVITHVASVSGGGWLPEPNGQPRYVSTLQVYCHPPADLTG